MTILPHSARRAAVTLVGLCAIAAAACFSERSTASTAICEDTATPCRVDIRDFAFEPAILRVRAGATVTWTNQGPTPHTSTSDDGVWDSPTLQPNATFSQTFSTTGEFPYHCEPHPTMTATIVVVQ